MSIRSIQTRADEADRAARRNRICVCAVNALIAVALIVFLAAMLDRFAYDALASIVEDTAATYALACERGADCR